MAFATYEYQIKPLDLTIHSEYLKLHLLNYESIYIRTCECVHKVGNVNNRISCRLINEKVCPRCGKNTQLLVPRYALYHHNCFSLNEPIAICASNITKEYIYRRQFPSKRILNYAYREGCGHKHNTRCGKCLNCNTYFNREDVMSLRSSLLPCQGIADNPHEMCFFSNDKRCVKHGVLTPMPHYNKLLHHIYNKQNSLFYICKAHKHYHWHPDVICYIQYKKCCDNAVHITEYNTSFKVQVLNKQFTIYQPTFWKQLTTSSFISFINTIILYQTSNKTNVQHKAFLKTLKESYDRLKTSKYTPPVSCKYLSGKFSFTRSVVVGFPTTGMHQTSIISCLLPPNLILISDYLYKIASEKYDMDHLVIKRDPCINGTCMHVVRILPFSEYEYSKYIAPNPNEITTICIPDSIAVPMNNDQDGDRNGGYMNAKKYEVNGIMYDRTNSFDYVMSKAEMIILSKKPLTFMGTPKFCFSEHNWYIIQRFWRQLLDTPEEETLDRQNKIHISFVPEMDGHEMENYNVPHRKNDIHLPMDLNVDTLSKTFDKRRVFNAIPFNTYLQNIKDVPIKVANGISCGFETYNHKRLLDKLIKFNASNNNGDLITVGVRDLTCTKGTNLSLITKHKIKGHENSIKDLIKTIKEKPSWDIINERRHIQTERYINSSKNLKNSGRKQFTILCALNDLVVRNGHLYLNKMYLANLNENICFTYFNFNKAALQYAIQCIKRAVEPIFVKNNDTHNLTLLNKNYKDLPFHKSPVNSYVLIKKVSAYMIRTFLGNDKTLCSMAFQIAFQMLLEFKFDIHLVMCILSAREKHLQIRTILYQLIVHNTGLFDPTPKSIVESGTFDNATYIQDALNYKQPQMKAGEETTQHRTIIPEFKVDMLYRNDTYIWFRVYLYDDDNIKVIENEYGDLVKVIKNAPHIYEIYFDRATIQKCRFKNQKNLIIIYNFIRNFDLSKMGYLIFCSELILFGYNYYLFISNFIKFHFCYKQNKESFNPTEPEHFAAIAQYFILAMIFFPTKNLNRMTTKSHHPLIAYTGERPSDTFNNVNNIGKTFKVEGSRCLMSFGKPSDIGMFSGFVDTVCELDVSSFKQQRPLFVSTTRC